MSTPVLPAEIEASIARGRRLEYWTLGWMASIVAVMYVASGSSQAMKSAWIEDCLSLIPPVLFLIGAHLERKTPTRRFPYGFERFGSLGFFGAAVALLTMGGFLLYEAISTLVARDHPTIGSIDILGAQIWLGWLMIAALAYSVVPPVILGRMKRPVARKISDKILYTDAAMNAADWHTGLAGIAGVVGITFGFWWADALAAGLISLSILKDGIQNCRTAFAELLDGAPRAIGSTSISPDATTLVAALEEEYPGCRVRVRETGRFMRATVVPREAPTLAHDRAVDLLGEDHWRVVEIGFSRDCLSRGRREEDGG